MSIEEKKENEEFENNVTQVLLNESIKANEPYLQTLPQAEPITLLQFQKLLHPDVEVYIKPNNHKMYWKGQALFIPKEMYDWKVRDISLRKRNEEEVWEHGSIALFVDFDETYDSIADSKELQEINEYHLPYRTEVF